MNYSVYNNLEEYDFLMNMYIDIIHNLIDYSVKIKIMPIKMNFFINHIKKYINENRLEVLDNGIKNILENKEIILNFNINNLDNLDDDINDITLKNNFNIGQNLNTNETDFLNLIIDIKNNSKNISEDNINIVKAYFETIINILEKINNLF